MNKNTIPKICHCGKKMHLSPSQEILLKQWGKSWGEFKKVILSGGKTYKIPSYYIVLHGLKYNEVPNLGFEEWPAA